jgi:preprotein translocase subunit SecD
MRFRLRTLSFATALLPPILAFMCIYWRGLLGLLAEVTTLLAIMACVALVTAIPVALVAFAATRVARVILYVGRHSDNRV